MTDARQRRLVEEFLAGSGTNGGTGGTGGTGGRKS